MCINFKDQSIHVFKPLFEKYFIPFQRPFKPDELIAFAKDFASTYKSVFGSKSGNFVAWFLANLLKSGKPSWESPSLVLLSTLLP